jgi:hypothetical protein
VIPKAPSAISRRLPTSTLIPTVCVTCSRRILQVGNLTKGSPIAEKLLTVHNDPEGLFLLAEGCARLGQYQEALEVYTGTPIACWQRTRPNC